MCPIGEFVVFLLVCKIVLFFEVLFCLSLGGIIVLMMMSGRVGMCCWMYCGVWDGRVSMYVDLCVGYILWGWGVGVGVCFHVEKCNYYNVCGVVCWKVFFVLLMWVCLG